MPLWKWSLPNQYLGPSTLQNSRMALNVSVSPIQHIPHNGTLRNGKHVVGLDAVTRYVYTTYSVDYVL